MVLYMKPLRKPCQKGKRNYCQTYQNFHILTLRFSSHFCPFIPSHSSLTFTKSTVVFNSHLSCPLEFITPICCSVRFITHLCCSIRIPYSPLLSNNITHLYCPTTLLTSIVQQYYSPLLSTRIHESPLLFHKGSLLTSVVPSGFITHLLCDNVHQDLLLTSVVPLGFLTHLYCPPGFITHLCCSTRIHYSPLLFHQDSLLTSVVPSGFITHLSCSMMIHYSPLLSTRIHYSPLLFHQDSLLTSVAPSGFITHLCCSFRIHYSPLWFH